MLLEVFQSPVHVDSLSVVSLNSFIVAAASLPQVINDSSRTHTHTVNKQAGRKQSGRIRSVLYTCQSA